MPVSADSRPCHLPQLATLARLSIIVIAAAIAACAQSSCPQASTDPSTRESQAALIHAMNQGDTASAISAIKSLIEVNARDSSCRTPILYAAQWGRLEAVEALLKAGADLNVRDPQGWTPVALAFEFSHFDVAQALIKAGADRSQLPQDLNAKDSAGTTPMQRAFRNEDMKSVRALVEMGADPNADAGTGRSYLAWASMNGSTEIVKILLGAGANPNFRKEKDWTPLLLAAQAGHSDVVKALVAAHADGNITGPDGWNALMQASNRGDFESVQALIPVTNVNYRNKDEISALMLARWGCHADVVKLLKDAGAATDPREWMRAPRFADYPVTRIHKGAVAKVDLASNPLAREYRTRLREGARGGPNFAGHYTVVSWGCGTSCQSYAVVDSLTGKVYAGFGAERGAEFKINSNLVIADPAFSQPDGDDDPIAKFPSRYLLWSNNSWRLVYQTPCSVQNPECTCKPSSQSATTSTP